MKRCAKCNRTFPDDNQKFCTFDGGLLASEQPFDPNATFRSSAPLTAPPPPAEKPASTPPPDFSATIATSSSAPTAVLPRNTGPTGAPTVVDQSAPRTPSAPLPPPASPPPPKTTSAQAQTPSIPIPPPVAQAKKKSKLPLIIGVLLLLLVLGVGAVVAAFFLVIKPRLDEQRSDQPVASRSAPAENSNANTATTNAPPTATTEFVPPPNTLKFTNSKANLEGKLAEHYFDFSFYYPSGWQVDPKAGVAGASNFAKVERRLPPDFTQENFAVGWYSSKGTSAADEPTYPQLVELVSSNLAKSFPEYQKVSEGPTKVNSLDGYEFRFTSISKGTEKGDIQVWGRVIFLPPGREGEPTGATLIMLATSLAPELSGVEDVGVKGEMPVILESFRFGRK